MPTLRSHVVIDAAPEAVWKVVRDAAAVADWFPAMARSWGDDTHRTVVLADGSTLEEAVVTADPVLRRFQYRVVGGDLSVEQHLGTVDVIELEPQRSLVVYSTEIEPAALAGPFEAAISEAVRTLPTHVA
ncbi:SRPBCC family protein [Pseudonocardia sp. C8]|uniref:SRPBCC family protein n=1 Tax=Pseudonocardia sp. C8 TaxID=2762759 RepID=UPI0016428CC3|nr:SRPBCC family protein [Pseudonocardia sp. C8]MBC3190362.1 SRPBCC family protein [Pseudonocardia sp. C8]